MASKNHHQHAKVPSATKRKKPDGPIRNYDPTFLGFTSLQSQSKGGKKTGELEEGEEQEENDEHVQVIEISANTWNNPWTQLYGPGQRESIVKLPLDHPMPLEGETEFLTFHKTIAPFLPPKNGKPRTGQEISISISNPTSTPAPTTDHLNLNQSQQQQENAKKGETFLTSQDLILNLNENQDQGNLNPTLMVPVPVPVGNASSKKSSVLNRGKRQTLSEEVNDALHTLKSNMSTFIKKTNIMQILKKKTMKQLQPPPSEFPKAPTPKKIRKRISKNPAIDYDPEEGQGHIPGFSSLDHNEEDHHPSDENDEGEDKLSSQQPPPRQLSSVQLISHKVKFLDEVRGQGQNQGQKKNLNSISNWPDNFSVKTNETSHSNADADTLSIKTADVFKDDGQAVETDSLPSVSDLSTTAATINESLYTLHHTHFLPKKLWKDHQRSISSKQIAQQFIHSHVITKSTLRKTNWEVGYESLTVKKCVSPITRGQLNASQNVLTSLKFSKLTAFKNVITFLEACPNISRLSFSNVMIVQKRIFDEAEFDLLELPKLKELEICNWLLCLSKSDYWLLNYFSRAVSFPNLEVFILRGVENMLTEKNMKTVKTLFEEIPDSSIVTKFLLRNCNSLKMLSLGGLGLKLMDLTDLSRFTNLPALQLSSLKVSLNPEGTQMILRNQKKLRNFSCSGFIDKVDERLKSTLANVMENNCTTLTTVGIFPCIILDKNQSLTYSNAYSLNCDIFLKCRKLENLFINVTMAAVQVSHRRSCGKLMNIHMLPLTLVHLELYNHEFSLYELAQLGDQFHKFKHLKSLVLSCNASRLYIVHLQWIKSLFAHPKFKTADFFGGKVENMKEFKDFILSKPKNYLAMTKISDCLSFYRPNANDDALSLNNVNNGSNLTARESSGLMTKSKVNINN